MTGLGLVVDDVERFWTKIVKSEGCWEWQAGRGREGYGRLMWQRKVRRAHRVAWEIVNGPVPPGLELDHLCRNRACCNPAHLEAVTHRENNRRGHGLPAINARKTHCDHGHPFDEANTQIRVWRTRTMRVCRACKSAATRRYQVRVAAARRSLRAAQHAEPSHD